jgi:hypothetical protein
VVCRPANLDLRSPLPKPDKTTTPSRPGRPAPDRGLLLHVARMPEWSVSRSHKKWFKTEAFKQVGEKYGAGGELREWLHRYSHRRQKPAAVFWRSTMRSYAGKEEPRRRVAERRASAEMETWREARLPAFPVS